MSDAASGLAGLDANPRRAYMYLDSLKTLK